ncbi:unnamed protein product, partial [Symbiodinium pilosum]
YGLWIFVGMRFARILGPSQGKGTVASAYCQSLAQLRQIRGKSEVDKELNNLYEAVFGVVEEPGQLRTCKKSRCPEADSMLYDASDPDTGTISVGPENVVYKTPDGRTETWRIVDWTFDPFARAKSPVPSRATSLAPDSEEEPPATSIAEEDDEEEGMRVTAQAHDPDPERELTDVGEPSDEEPEPQVEEKQEDIKQKAKLKARDDEEEQPTKTKKGKKPQEFQEEDEEEMAEKEEEEEEEDEEEAAAKKKKKKKKKKHKEKKSKLKDSQCEEEVSGGEFEEGAEEEFRVKKEKKTKHKKDEREKKQKKDKKSKKNKARNALVQEEEEEEAPQEPASDAPGEEPSEEDLPPHRAQLRGMRLRAREDREATLRVMRKSRREAEAEENGSLEPPARNKAGKTKAKLKEAEIVSKDKETKNKKLKDRAPPPKEKDLKRPAKRKVSSEEPLPAKGRKDVAKKKQRV